MVNGARQDLLPSQQCSRMVLGSSAVTLYPCTGLSVLLPFFPDDLASKANILIDPLELQAATMDDLDEDEEPALAAAQVPR